MEKVAIILFMVAVVPVASQLECFVCKGDDCPEYSYDSVPSNSTMMCTTPCVKTVQDLSSGIKVERGCLDDRPESGQNPWMHGCDVINTVFLGKSATKTTCVCHNDKCNSASVITSTLTMVTLAALLAKLM